MALPPVVVQLFQAPACNAVKVGQTDVSTFIVTFACVPADPPAFVIQVPETKLIAVALDKTVVASTLTVDVPPELLLGIDVIWENKKTEL